MEIPIKPDYDDVMAAVADVLQRCPQLCISASPGTSEQGREIPGLQITDPNQPENGKQHVLIIASQHGSEESGRAMALELIHWLTSEDPDAVETRKNQAVIILPCVNPDGVLADTYHNGNDIDIAHTYNLDKTAGTLEGRAVEKLAYEFLPDIFVDIHGLAGGSMKDRVWLSRPLAFTPDRYFQTVIARAMTDAGEAAGFPQCEPVPPAPFEGGTYSLGEKLAVEIKSLAFGLESIEHYYNEKEWRADGLARLKVLLAFGNQDAFGLGEPGYPSALVSGSRICGLKAHGNNPAQRRGNRCELITFLRNNYSMVDRQPDGLEGACRVKIVSNTLAGPNPGRFSILLRFKKPCTLKNIIWEKETLTEAAEHGYNLIPDHSSFMLQVNLQAPFGGPERWLTVEYDSPWIKNRPEVRG